MDQLIAATKALIKENWIRALIGGFVGTVVFTLMGKFLAPQVIGQPMDVAVLLTPIFGGSHTAGAIAHFVNGTVLFPIAYLALGILLFTRTGLATRGHISNSTLSRRNGRDYADTRVRFLL